LPYTFDDLANPKVSKAISYVTGLSVADIENVLIYWFTKSKGECYRKIVDMIKKIIGV